MKKRSFACRGKYKFILFPLCFILALILLGGTVMFLWNWLMPTIFGLTTLSFWQAIGLFILARLLFSGKGFKGRPGSFGGRDFGRHTQEEREKWMTMSCSERREWFKQRGFNRGSSFPSQHDFVSDATKEENVTPGNE